MNSDRMKNKCMDLQMGLRMKWTAGWCFKTPPPLDLQSFQIALVDAGDSTGSVVKIMGLSAGKLVG